MVATVQGLRLVPVIWAGVNLNGGDREDGVTVVVTDVEGWFGSPPLTGHDLEGALSDGAIFGHKTAGARQVIVSGAATGPRGPLLAYSRDLAALAMARDPADLAIAEDTGGDEEGLTLTAACRADAEGLAHAWHGPGFFTYQLALTAADPRLFESSWNEATLTLGGEGESGREYPREYPWEYGSSALPNTARLVNAGSAAAPVMITYTGDLSETRLTDGVRSIRVAPLAAGQQITVISETLAASAPGGASRASHLLAGSEPMTIAPRALVTWRLYGTGGGAVLLRWRGAFA
jgi:hypothetical protein